LTDEEKLRLVTSLKLPAIACTPTSRPSLKNADPRHPESLKIETHGEMMRLLRDFLLVGGECPKLLPPILSANP
jgi:hypothetical protein